MADKVAEPWPTEEAAEAAADGMRRITMETMPRLAAQLRECWAKVGEFYAKTDATYRGNTAAKRAFRIEAGAEHSQDTKQPPFDDQTRSYARKYWRERERYAEVESNDPITKTHPRHFILAKNGVKGPEKSKVDPVTRGFRIHQFNGFSMAEVQRDHQALLAQTARTFSNAARGDPELAKMLGALLADGMSAAHTAAILGEPDSPTDTPGVLRAKAEWRESLDDKGW